MIFGPEGGVFRVYRILMKFNASGNSGVIPYISDFQQPCLSKTAGLRAKYTPKFLCYTFFFVDFAAFFWISPSFQAEPQSPLGFLFICFWSALSRFQEFRISPSGLAKFINQKITELP